MPQVTSSMHDAGADRDVADRLHRQRRLGGSAAGGRRGLVVELPHDHGHGGGDHRRGRREPHGKGGTTPPAPGDPVDEGGEQRVRQRLVRHRLLEHARHRRDRGDRAARRAGGPTACSRRSRGRCRSKASRSLGDRAPST